MPQFKVGDSVRVIGQRICPSNGNVPIGATGKIFRIAGREYLVEFDPKIPSGEAYAGFMADSLELCHDKKFKVGDAVRVKAGSPIFCGPTVQEYPPDWIFGKQLTVCDGSSLFGYPGRTFVATYSGAVTNCKDVYLEPWNAAEEWNGTAWVAKKKSEPKPCVVVKRGAGCACQFFPSTNAAAKDAERRAKEWPGEEFVVYQEKASFKVEKPSRKIGSQWRVCWRQYLDDHVYFANGTIVTLVADDCAIMPLFSGPSKQNGEMRSACVEMKRLEPV